jgi:flagella basal body P-ring formation protein FlgA
LIVHTLVPVAAEPANPGQFVKIEAARVPLHALAGTPIEPDTSNRWIARTTLATGTALTTARVKSAPDADTGADIELVAISGTIAIRAPGRLLAAARIGDTVRVANLATNKVVEGTLISPQSVRISR